MGLTTAMWKELERRLHPEAWRELVEYCAETDIDPEDRVAQVLAKAIEAHEKRTGVALTFHF